MNYHQKEFNYEKWHDTSGSMGADTHNRDVCSLCLALMSEVQDDANAAGSLGEPSLSTSRISLDEEELIKLVGTGLDVTGYLCLALMSEV